MMGRILKARILTKIEMPTAILTKTENRTLIKNRAANLTIQTAAEEERVEAKEKTLLL